MSNINGWFSNIRRRCGWNTMCTKWTQGNRLEMRDLMLGCFTGEVRDEVLVREIKDVIDYITGKTKGRIGSWLTEVSLVEVVVRDRKADVKSATQDCWR